MLCPSHSTRALKHTYDVEKQASTGSVLLQTHADGIEFKGLLSSAWWGHSDSPVQDDKPAPQTLVLYIFSNTDPEYIDNLRFYVRTGIQEGDGCHHVIVVNSGPGSPVCYRLRCPSPLITTAVY